MDSVEVHPNFSDQFDKSDAEDLELREGLIAAFAYWAEYGFHPDFGKDVTYQDPEGSVIPKVGLRHVHLKPLEMTARQARLWNDKNTDPIRKTSDRHLVYVASDENDRLLLYYFEHDAHVRAREASYSWLKALGRAAQEWLNETGRFPAS
ncbi:type II toxin-antitoxin system YafO family toxin [Pseudomonas typographi]|uniref:type II toxin-antitoxin system YafO family toxin n=1 Tax=Pseudomonas typographi TaxID=2715964 RepID=UPI001685E053|nr:type II toxin-antitoxin system YafO family toxin [Pseudomonas typographi]MBD1554760.1 hypothetical protein [Pseudomonas typographi]